jgi:hypothetical protein
MARVLLLLACLLACLFAAGCADHFAATATPAQRALWDDNGGGRN